VCELFGMEEALIKLYTNRKVIEAALARLDEFYTAFYAGILDTCADELEIFGLGDDFAGNDGLLISPDLWRSLFKPLYAKWLEMAKAKGLYTFMHCCGNLMAVLPDLIDIGLDAWQTVQTHLPGQAPEIIKQQYGRQLVFIGAIDTTNILSALGRKYGDIFDNA
jgi:uroporphyrinogen decarboxylase